MRLLLAEIEHNAEVIRTIAERLRREFPLEDLIGHPDFPTLKTRTWIGVRGGPQRSFRATSSRSSTGTTPH